MKVINPILLNKEKFIEIMSIIYEQFEHDRKVNKLLEEIFEDGQGYPKNNGIICALTDLLKILLFDEEDIEYFMYDLDFGKEWQPGMIKCLNKDTGEEDDINLSTAEKLYDYLISK
jgi:hypothetical protein